MSNQKAILKAKSGEFNCIKIINPGEYLFQIIINDTIFWSAISKYRWLVDGLRDSDINFRNEIKIKIIDLVLSTNKIKKDKEFKYIIK